MRLENKVALVTGGGSGIGEATSRTFAREGAAVAVVDLRREPAERVAQEIVAAGGKAVAVEADVSGEAAMQAAVASTVEAFGGLHVAFANAGINGVHAPIEEITCTWPWIGGGNKRGEPCSRPVLDRWRCVASRSC